MSKNPQEKKDRLDTKQYLFSEDSFKFPFYYQNNKPLYNPVAGAMYLPRVENETIRFILSGHEIWHEKLSKLPFTCLERIISMLIHYEFTRNKFSQSSNFSALLPSKNPVIKLLKSIAEILHYSNASTQEAFAFQRIYQFSRESLLKKAGLDPEVWLKKAINSSDIGLPDFRSISKQFCKSDFMWQIRYLIKHFSFAPPIIPIELPVNKEGIIDQRKINSDTVKAVLKRFKFYHQKIKYSPWKRFKALVSIANKMEKSNIKLSSENYIKQVKDYEGLPVKTFSGMENGFDYRVCPYDKDFCPVDSIREKGLNIPFEDYGYPTRKLDNDGFGKMIHCRVSKERMPDLVPDDSEKMKKRDESSFRQNHNKLDTLINNIQRKRIHGKTKTWFFIGKQSDGNFVNWPLPAFLIASEILKNIVFRNKEKARNSTRIVLTQYFNPKFLDGHKKYYSNCSFEGKIKLPNLNTKINISPFITIKSKRAVNKFDGLELFIKGSQG